jgi:glycosyltransferase involved in cell wall biosynthesis
MILKIAIIKSVIPSYREGFYDGLFAQDDLSVTVFCQKKIPGFNLKYIHDKYPNNVHLVKFLTADREKISWQFIPWLRVFNDFDVVFVEGNPRNITHFLVSTILRLFNKKVVLWTMAHSFNANPFTEGIRLYWSRIFKFLFVYNDAEVDFLRNKGFSKQIILGMNNGLDQKKIDIAISKWPLIELDRWIKAKKIDNRRLILSCARLDRKNKYHQLIQALPLIVTHVSNVLWCIIGNGPEEKSLTEMIKERGLENYVHFVGEVYNEEELAPWFLCSEMLVHPAGIGLTILHAFGYGLPVITHGNAMFHGPEYAAFKEGSTGYNFVQDSIEDLAEKTLMLLGENELRAQMKENTQKIARNEFNVDVMVKRFVEISKVAAIDK